MSDFYLYFTRPPEKFSRLASYRVPESQVTFDFIWTRTPSCPTCMYQNLEVPEVHAGDAVTGRRILSLRETDGWMDGYVDVGRCTHARVRIYMCIRLCVSHAHEERRLMKDSSSLVHSSSGQRRLTDGERNIIKIAGERERRKRGRESRSRCCCQQRRGRRRRGWRATTSDSEKQRASERAYPRREEEAQEDDIDKQSGGGRQCARARDSSVPCPLSLVPSPGTRNKIIIPLSTGMYFFLFLFCLFV